MATCHGIHIINTMIIIIIIIIICLLSFYWNYYMDDTYFTKRNEYNKQTNKNWIHTQ